MDDGSFLLGMNVVNLYDPAICDIFEEFKVSIKGRSDFTLNLFIFYFIFPFKTILYTQGDEITRKRRKKKLYAYLHVSSHGHVKNHIHTYPMIWIQVKLITVIVLIIEVL